jgi:hypothetical protein
MISFGGDAGRAGLAAAGVIMKWRWPMSDTAKAKVALIYPGDYQARLRATAENNRLAAIFKALADLGLQAEPAVYHDYFCDEVREQIMGVDAVLVWMNPIQDGRDRTVLDGILREVAASGVFVSAHPDVVLKIGTKEVLYTTRDMGWGSDVHLYSSLEQMRKELPGRLVSGGARVLKQYRGNGGLGVWKVEAQEPGVVPKAGSILKVRHAKKGGIEERISLAGFLERCAGYFSGPGRMIDQAYQERLPEGMIRCYLVRDKVAGFGLQAINALYPAPEGAPSSQSPQPGPRLYHPPSLPQYQELKRKLEQEWVPQMQGLLDINYASLPILWDCDFLLGTKDDDGEDTYVLCEINVSSVAPFPDSAPPHVAKAVMDTLKAV